MAARCARLRVASSLSWADSGYETKHIESIRKEVFDCVDQHRRVVVDTYDNRRLQGAISEANADDFVVACAGRTNTLSYGDVKKVKWESLVWRQVKVVAGAAAVVGVIVGMVVLLGGLKG